MGAKQIISGWSVEYPASFMRSRYGHGYVFNGLNHPMRWDGQTSAAERMGMRAPIAGPTIGDDTAGGSISPSKDYFCAYRYIDDEQPQPVPSSISILTKKSTTGAANHRFDWSALQQPQDARAVAVELWRTTGNQATTLYQLVFNGGTDRTNPTNIGVGGTITSSQDTGGTVRFNVPPGHRAVIGAVITVSSHTEAGHNGSNQVITGVAPGYFVTDKTFVAPGTGGTWILTGYQDDGTSDDALDDSLALPIIHEAGTLSARRFTPPPDFKAVGVPFLDRYWLAVDRIYRKGTVATNGTTTITGTGTDWPAEMVGRFIYLDDEEKPYLITARGSATSLTVSEAVANTASGVSYAIRPPPVERGQIYYSEPDEPESWPAINVMSIPDSPNDDDEITGLMCTVSVLYVLKERHMFRVTYVSQPQANPSVSLATSRGCLNQRCWVFHEGDAYLMDQAGIWRYANQYGTEPLSPPLQDVFRDGTIDFSRSEWFWAAKDPRLETLYWFVCYKGEEYPQHALCLNVRTRQWWTESYPYGFGHGCLVNIDGTVRLAAVGPDDRLFLLNEGTLDGTSGEGTTRGYVTNATATTLEDTEATFPDDIVGAPVTIVEGTGAGQTRFIESVDGDELTVATWTTTPDATSVYQIGNIHCTWKTGKLRVQRMEDGQDSGQNQRRDVKLLFEPTTADVNGVLRVWRDRSQSATVMRHSSKNGVNIEFTKGSADIKLRMQYDDGQPQAGYARLGLDGVIGERSDADRFLQVEGRFDQGADQIVLYDLIVDGVEGP
jgi:hypothetical protein